MNETDTKGQLHQLQIRYSRCLIIIAVFFLNFFAFVAVAAYIGGDAINGKFENGHYYVFGVATNSSGKIYTEVSREVFNYSRFHNLITFLTWPVCIALMSWATKLKAEISALEGNA